MPHLIIEYSRNLREAVGPDALVDALHTAAVGTDEFPPMSLRTRAVERECYRVGDGHPDNGFIHITLRIRPGRERARKVELGETVFAAALAHLDSVFEVQPIGLTLEVEEIDISFRFLKNNMVEHWAKRARSSADVQAT